MAYSILTLFNEKRYNTIESLLPIPAIVIGSNDINTIEELIAKT